MQFSASVASLSHTRIVLDLAVVYSEVTSQFPKMQLPGHWPRVLPIDTRGRYHGWGLILVQNGQIQAASCLKRISREITQAGKRAFWWFGGV
jgi:hypothetical protein